MSRIFTRLLDGCLLAFDPSASDDGVLEPVFSLPMPPDLEVVAHAVLADRSRALYATRDEVVCVARTGDEQWRYALEPASTVHLGHRPTCEFSRDGAAVWLYRADAMAERGRADHWAILDAETGAVIDKVDLGTSGHGAMHYAHPNGTDHLIDVGEGQDGSFIFRGSLSEGALDLFAYPWNDRCMIGLSPDGSHFMTVHHEQADVVFHAYPNGDPVLQLSVDAFGHDPDEAYVEWSGGYLDDNTAIVTITGADEDEDEDDCEWHRHYFVDLSTGDVGPELSTASQHPYDIEPLGDRSWLTTHADGRPVRWRLDQ